MVDLGNIFLASAVADAVAKFIEYLYKTVGNYGLAVILFTIILKLVMSPLDVWQKISLRKNNKAMERMKPQIEKLQKQYGNNKELFSQKQMALYKKEGYSMFGSCLPTIISMAIFFMIFAGFRAEVKKVNVQVYQSMKAAYTTALDNGATTEDAEAAVIEAYETEYKDKLSFVWVKNVFVADNWSKPIPSYKTFTSTGLGGVGVGVDEIGNDSAEYDKVMKPLQEKYSGWNGWLILPILSVVITILTSKLTQPQQPPVAQNEQSAQAAQANMKMMQYMMPAMFGFFALFYSTAFTIYMFTSSLVTTLFQLIYNYFAKIKDKKEEEIRLKTTYK